MIATHETADLPYTIHVVDDDAAVCEALVLLLEMRGYRVATYRSGAAFLAQTPRGRGCIVLDMRLGDMSGYEVLEELARRGNPLPVIVLTAYGDIPAAVRAMRSGATDFLSKADDPAVLIACIRRVLAESAERRQNRAEQRFSRSLEKLSRREHEIFRLALSGLDSLAIAARLGLSLRTVEVHRSHIARKFEVNSLAEVFRLAARELGQ